MRTTVTLDDQLVADAQRMTGVMEKSALISVALRALVQSEAARRLALMGGSDPTAKGAPRRRSAL